MRYFKQIFLLCLLWGGGTEGTEGTAIPDLTGLFARKAQIIDHIDQAYEYAKQNQIPKARDAIDEAMKLMRQIKLGLLLSPEQEKAVLEKDWAEKKASLQAEKPGFEQEIKEIQNQLHNETSGVSQDKKLITRLEDTLKRRQADLVALEKALKEHDVLCE